MENNNNGLVLIGRREVLRMVGLGVGGMAVLTACKKEEAAAPAAAPPPAKPVSTACMDKVPVDDAAKSLRATLQYKEKSEIPEKKCSACSQFEAAKYGDCGGCKLFAGGVNPEGHCLSFAPKAPAPGAAASQGG